MTSRCGQHSRPAQMVFGFVKSLKRAMRRDHITITSWPRVILAGFCRTTGNNGSFRDWSGLVWPRGLRKFWYRTNCKQPSHLLKLSRRSSRSCEVIVSHLSMTTSRMFMLRVGSGSMQCWPMRVSIGRRLQLDRCDAGFPTRLPCGIKWSLQHTALNLSAGVSIESSPSMSARSVSGEFLLYQARMTYDSDWDI